MSIYSKLGSAIFNNIYSGLKGYHQTPTISVELIEDQIVNERLLIIKEYTLRGVLPRKELLMSLNCIPVDCESLDRCRCSVDACDELVAHFEIPQIALEFGDGGIDYIGTTDRLLPFIIYTSSQALKYNKYRKRSKKKPFVFIDFTPNSNNMNDGFIFNAPLIQQISAVFIPKDPRLLELFGCCDFDKEINNVSFIDNEVEKRVTEKLIRWYRLFAVPEIPNNLSPE